MLQKEKDVAGVLKNELALLEDELYSSSEESEKTKKFVIVCLRNEWYGIDSRFIRQIIPIPEFAPLPNVPRHILGIFNLRGNVESLTDLGTLIGIDGDAAVEGARVVVVEEKNLTTGLLVDKIDTIVDLPTSKIDEAIHTLQGRETEIIEGQMRNNGKTVAIVNVPQVLMLSRPAK